MLPGQTGNAGKLLGTNGATASWIPGGVIYRDPRTANTALALSDIGKWIDTSGTFTQTFSASAALTASWWAWITNTGTGQVTLTPNGAELIDGATSRILYPGERRLVQCDGLTLRTVAGGTIVTRRPIFALTAATMNAGSNLERIENVIATSVASASVAPAFATNGVNVIACAGVSSSVGSTPDGRTWTARTTPTGNFDSVASDGSGFLIIQGGTTTVAYSAAGTSWAATTALPGSSTSGKQVMASLGPGIYAVLSGSSNAVYRTANSGTSWTTEATFGGYFPLYACAGLLVGINSITLYYTSATALAGSWTSRTMPGTTSTANMRVDFDGSLIASSFTDGTVWRSTNGITWTQLSGITLPFPAVAAMTINGVLINGTSASAGFSALYGGKWVLRTSSLTTTAGISNVKIGSAYLISMSSGQLTLIDPTATDAATGLFD